MIIIFIILLALCFILKHQINILVNIKQHLNKENRILLATLYSISCYTEPDLNKCQEPRAADIARQALDAHLARASKE